jgi:crotonobetainyl-CoA:carnitine CoA-transferase CaiB-like acyl-CoA transferase
LLQDRFRTQAARLQNQDALDAVIEEWMASRESHETVMRLQEAGIPASRVLTGDHMYRAPFLEERDYYCTVQHSVTGIDRYPGWPFRFCPGPMHHHRFSSPTLGQHNFEVLTEMLDVPPDQIDGLRKMGVIGEEVLG